MGRRKRRKKRKIRKKKRTKKKKKEKKRLRTRKGARNWKGWRTDTKETSMTPNNALFTTDSKQERFPQKKTRNEGSMLNENLRESI